MSFLHHARTCDEIACRPDLHTGTRDIGDLRVNNSMRVEVWQSF